MSPHPGLYAGESSPASYLTDTTNSTPVRTLEDVEVDIESVTRAFLSADDADTMRSCQAKLLNLRNERKQLQESRSLDNFDSIQNSDNYRDVSFETLDDSPQVASPTPPADSNSSSLEVTVSQPEPALVSVKSPPELPFATDSANNNSTYGQDSDGGNYKQERTDVKPELADPHNGIPSPLDDQLRRFPDFKEFRREIEPRLSFDGFKRDAKQNPGQVGYEPSAEVATADFGVLAEPDTQVKAESIDGAQPNGTSAVKMEQSNGAELNRPSVDAGHGLKVLEVKSEPLSERARQKQPLRDDDSSSVISLDVDEDDDDDDDDLVISEVRHIPTPATPGGYSTSSTHQSPLKRPASDVVDLTDEDVQEVSRRRIEPRSENLDMSSPSYGALVDRHTWELVRHTFPNNRVPAHVNRFIAETSNARQRILSFMNMIRTNLRHLANQPSTTQTLLAGKLEVLTRLLTTINNISFKCIENYGRTLIADSQQVMVLTAKASEVNFATTDSIAGVIRGVVAVMSRPLGSSLPPFIGGERPRQSLFSPAQSTPSGSGAPVDLFSGDPQTTASIKKLLDNIRPDEEIGPEDRTGTPDEMAYDLYAHQKLGLTWLHKMEDNDGCKGGILADDMGLGKTIQMVSLMVSRPSDNPRRKTTLILAPVALLGQWRAHIAEYIKPEHALRVAVMHGAGARQFRSVKDFEPYDVIISTYGVVAREYKKHTCNEDPARIARGESEPSPVFQKDWYRIILDEAQYIKNKLALTSRACVALEANYRWCLSGTPMQNRVEELYSLLRFLKIEPYCHEQKFMRDIGRGLSRDADIGDSNGALKKLRVLLKATMLRRTKKSEVDGKPILNLPPRTVELKEYVFDEDEESYYRDLESGAIARMNRFIDENTVSKNYSNILTLLLRLRQACCHPKLITRSEQLKAELFVKERTTQKTLEAVRRLDPEVIRRVSEEETFTCPICQDAIDKINVVLFYPCGHWVCSDCAAEYVTRAKEDAESVECCTCRQHISPDRAIDYTTFEQAHIEGLSDRDIMAIWKERKVELRREKLDRNMAIRRLRQDQADANMFVDETEPRAVESDIVNSEAKRENERNEASSTEEESDNEFNSGLATPSFDPGTKDTIVNEMGLSKLFPQGWVSSTKITKCVELLHQLHEEYPGQKVLIFSQFTSLLDLVEVPLIAERIPFLRYDGSMDADARSEAVAQFDQLIGQGVMLLSMKAGNVGLTLTSAQHVIILDPFWNPYVEEQAMDRAHRIGQRLPVFVHRLIVRNTVEDRIMALQQKKKELIDAALDETGILTVSKLSQDQLMYLFGVSRNGQPVTRDDVPV